MLGKSVIGNLLSGHFATPAKAIFTHFSPGLKWVKMKMGWE
jgi:hypothetical protein